MPAIADGLTAMVALKGHLETALAARYDETFKDANDEFILADVVLEDDEPESPDQVGKPYVVLSLESDVKDVEWGFHYRMATVGARVLAGDFSGAQTGTANPVGADTLLSQALQAIIEEDWEELEALGLQGIEIMGPQESIDKNAETPTLHENSHSIEFHYRTR